MSLDASTLLPRLRAALAGLALCGGIAAQEGVGLPGDKPGPVAQPQGSVPDGEPCAVRWAWADFFTPGTPQFAQRQQHMQQHLAWLAAAHEHGPVFSAGPLVIPVVVHVVLNVADPAAVITHDVVMSQIDALNRDFGCTTQSALIHEIQCTSSGECWHETLAGAPCLQFALAEGDPKCPPFSAATGGITWSTTTVAKWDLKTDTESIKHVPGAEAWDTEHYLNIWVGVTKASSDGDDVPVGVATLPGDTGVVQGVVIDWKSFGNMESASWPASVYLPSGNERGCTTSHEVGHYFDLLHLWGPGAPGDCFATDNIDDTPPQSVMHLSDCQPSWNSCPESVSLASDSTGPDLCADYMDYTDDAERVLFTQEQVEWMWATLFDDRPGLLEGPDGALATVEADPWIADAWDDDGSEPDMTEEPMYTSPDIWVRRQDDGLEHQSHQSPLANAGPQFVYVRVHNRGCGTGGSPVLNLYWAKASTGLSWTWPWTGGTVEGVVVGGLLESRSISVPMPGTSSIETFAWTPPDPAVYAGLFPDPGHMCLLARITTDSLAPFGMTTPETAELWDNVRANNNIAWKNVWVVDLSSLTANWSANIFVANPRRSRQRAWIVVRGGWRRDLKPLTAVADVSFDPVRPPKGAWIERVLQKGRELGLRPDAKGAFDPHELKLAGAHAVLGPFDLAPGESFPLAVTVKPHAGGFIAPGTYVLDVQQWTGQDRPEHPVGGGVLGVTVPKQSQPGKPK